VSKYREAPARGLLALKRASEEGEHGDHLRSQAYPRNVRGFTMLYMIVERFEADAQEVVRERFQKHGRLLPRGVEYVDSWVTVDGRNCYQLMTAESESLLQLWISRWSDVVRLNYFEVVPSSAFWEKRPSG